MKKVTCLIASIVLGVTIPAYSQSPDSKMGKLSMAVIGGPNFADMYFPNSSGPEDQEISAIPGFGAGVVFDFLLTENILIRMEPMYLQKGCKIKEGSDPVTQPQGQIRSSSVEIPLLIRFVFGNRIKPFLVAGPSAGWNLNSKIGFDLTGLKFNGDLKPITKTFDMGLTFGGGLQVPVGSVQVFFETKYATGLINQRRSGTVMLSSNGFEMEMVADKEEDRCTNRGIQLFFGIYLPI